jgi:hypothetical protein
MKPVVFRTFPVVNLFRVLPYNQNRRNPNNKFNEFWKLLILGPTWPSDISGANLNVDGA